MKKHRPQEIVNADGVVEWRVYTVRGRWGQIVRFAFYVGSGASPPTD